MSTDIELGPIDYLVIEYPNGTFTGEAVPHLIDLVDRGIVRILDIALVKTGEDGTAAAITLADLPEAEQAVLGVFEGADTGLLDEDDLAEIIGILEPGSAAAVLIYENTWAGPFAAAVRNAGGVLAAQGRIPVNALLDMVAN